MKNFQTQISEENLERAKVASIVRSREILHSVVNHDDVLIANESLCLVSNWRRVACVSSVAVPSCGIPTKNPLRLNNANRGFEHQD